MNPLILTVAQLNSYTRGLLEQDPHLREVFVVGEISNFTNHYRSGHWYFSLKDENAVIQGVMFRSSVQHMRFVPQDGMRVICRGRVTLYDRDGRYQLYAEDMQPDGLGSLNLQFEQTKEKLAKLGFFDEQNKKPFPAFPQKIAVVTSPTGAAVQDILNILTRRYPLATVLMCPVQVQGEDAVPQLVETVDILSQRSDVDLIILGRGGGSMEDLWAFNSEELAFSIYNCPIPVISAVGHETDYTISDFVADLRAPTPSAAAELAVPDMTDLKGAMGRYKELLALGLTRKVQSEEQKLKGLSESMVLKQPMTMLDPYLQRLDMLERRLQLSASRNLEQYKGVFSGLAGRLDAYFPLGVLNRGYAIAKKEDTIIRNAKELSVGDILHLQFGSGTAVCTVEQVENQ